MPAVTGIDKLCRKLDSLKKRFQSGNRSVVVGFCQRYATYVHENEKSQHNTGQAKFLEQPARQMRSDLARIIQQGLEKGLSLEKSLLLAGLRLQREAQKLTPVDTGALKASAFTAFENDVETAATSAFQKSEDLRQTKKAARAKKATERALKNLDKQRLHRTRVWESREMRRLKRLRGKK